MIESLIFFNIKTRPNIAFLILVISKFTKNLFYQYTKVIKIIL